ncbi:hypothetical protein KC460_04615, partial [Candidatus Dependentiae bacterium]|nr:hypothetical protein [Candidatus Dependentiae bacterium]
DPTAKGLICGATAMTLCGLGLLAWVKPNHFCKIKEEKKFNDSIINNLGPKITTLINNLGRGVVIHKQVNKATYKQDFEVNAAEYIENVIKNSYSFPGFQMNSDNFFKKNTDTIKSKIKRDINDRKNKTFLPWLFSKIIRSNTIEIIESNSMKDTALYYFYKKNAKSAINSAFYSFFFRRIIKDPYPDIRMIITFDMNGMLSVKAEEKDATILVDKNKKKIIKKEGSDLETLIKAVTKISDKEYKCITDWHKDVCSKVEEIQKAAAAKENNVVEQEVNEEKKNTDGDSSEKENSEKENNNNNNLKKGDFSSVVGSNSSKKGNGKVKKPDDASSMAVTAKQNIESALFKLNAIDKTDDSSKDNASADLKKWSADKQNITYYGNITKDNDTQQQYKICIRADITTLTPLMPGHYSTITKELQFTIINNSNSDNNAIANKICECIENWKKKNHGLGGSDIGGSKDPKTFYV